MKVSSLTIRSKDSDVSPGRMEGSTKEIGKLESSTEGVNISCRTGNQRSESGNKVKRFVGLRKRRMVQFIDIY